MSDQSEVERLLRCYREYAGSPEAHQQWSGSNKGNRATTEERKRVLKELLQRRNLLPLGSRRVLDVGCGCGRVLGGLQELGADSKSLHGVDLVPEEIAAARRLFPECDFSVANGEQLPFPDDHFDLVLTFTVFSSIQSKSMAAQVASEVARVLRPGGVLVWYDVRYNNPRNRRVHGITRKELAELFPHFTSYLRPVTLLPPVARRLGAATPVLYPALSFMPWLRTHYLGLLTPR